MSVLSSMHIYWSAAFILPTMVMKDIEAKMRGFLWCEGPMKKGKAKVCWKEICVPNEEGGHCIKRVG